jgi:hypothetical protein
MEREVKRKILRNTALFGAFAALVLWLVFFNEFTIGDFKGFFPYLPEQLMSTSLHVVLLPPFASISVFYVASILNASFEGTLKEVLISNLYATGFAVFFALFLIYSPSSETLNASGLLFLEAFAILLVYNTFATLSKVWNTQALKAVVASATIFVEGQITIRLLSLFLGSGGVSLPLELSAVLSDILNLGFTLAAAVSLLSILKSSRNPPLSAVGDMTSNYFLVVSACVAGSLYFSFFRGRLMSFSPGLENLSPYIEWTAICLIAALIFTRTRKGIQTSVVTETQMGEWMKHVQEVSTYKGERFIGFTGVVSEFLENGRKDRLVVKLIRFLHENRIEDDEIPEMLSEIIEYEDSKKPFFSLTGREEEQKKENTVRRRSVLHTTLAKILPPGLGGTKGLTGAKIGATDQPPATGLSEPLGPGMDSIIVNAETVGDEG